MFEVEIFHGNCQSSKYKIHNSRDFARYMTKYYDDLEAREWEEKKMENRILQLQYDREYKIFQRKKWDKEKERIRILKEKEEKEEKERMKKNDERLRKTNVSTNRF
uniref:Uncharacterized protein n=1 Tax=viral metagenome TaxID=1070528 RepID=A0A6C0JT42_9ZZZZ